MQVTGLQVIDRDRRRAFGPGDAIYNEGKLIARLEADGRRDQDIGERLAGRAALPFAKDSA